MTAVQFHATLTLAVAWCVSTVTCAASARGAELVLKEHARPLGGIVRVGDIAEVRKASANEVKRLQAVPLMPAPAPGSQHEISIVLIRDWLAMMGEDLSQIRFSGAPRVVVGYQSSAQTPLSVLSPKSPAPSAADSNATVTEALTQARLRRSVLSLGRRQELRKQLELAIADHIRQQSGDAGPWEANVRVSLTDLEQLARWESPVRIAGGADPWVGKRQFTVSFVDDVTSGEFVVAAEITRQQQAVVAVQGIEAGRIVTAADVELRYIPESSRRGSRRQFGTNLEDVVGLVARRRLRAGDVVYLDSLRAPLLVRRGDTITVTARGGGIQVSTYVQARNDGVSGDLIEVETLEGKERFYAKVVGRGEVEVF